MKPRLMFLLALLLLLSIACTISFGGGEADDENVTPEVAATQPAGQPGATSPADQPGDQPGATNPAAQPGGQSDATAQATQQVNLPIVGVGPGSATLTPEEFSALLANAILSRDYAALRSLMGDRFMMAGWRSEGRELTPDQAIAELQTTALAPGSDPVADFTIDPAGLLDGADPLAMFGPDSGVVSAFALTTLGPQASDEGIAFIARDENGRLYWLGLLVALGGFQQDTPVVDLNRFSEQLAAALEGRDFNTLRSLMADQFLIADWPNTQLTGRPSNQVVQDLQADTLAAGSSPAVIFGTDVPALLEGADPLGLWGPVADPVRALHVSGLGRRATEEGVAVIGRNMDGQFYFLGLLLPSDGYFHTANPQPNPGEAVETNVKFILVKEDVNLRSGPGMNYAVEGQVFGGMTLKVTGKSADGDWWRVVCEQDSSGNCWISADPDLTEPSDGL